MSEHYPALDIHFPPERESELFNEMKRRAVQPWSNQNHDPMGRTPTQDSFYFHRAVVGNAPSCTVCIHSDKVGHWVVQNIVPDAGQISSIPLDIYKNILMEFDSQIADPAAESVSGMSSIRYSKYRLEDYFSPRAVTLLQAFCSTSNQGDLGTHPTDQRKWMNFLITAYEDGKDIHCDVFGNCLRTAEWWPEWGIADLVREYDFAMRLLRQSGRPVGPK